MDDIAAHLNADGVPTKNGGVKYTSTQISNMLRNEKYMGDCLLQKHISINPITHRNIRNRGELDQYYIEDCYPAIIEKDSWFVVQEMMSQYGHNHLNSGEAHPFRGKMFFATMSSGKFKKGQALSKKAVFHSACPFLIHVFCLALFETQNYNILDGGAKWII